MWELLERRCLELYLAGVGPESRTLHLDGFNVRVPGVCPKYDKKTGQLINQGLITVPDGGYQAVYSAGTKGGNGFNVVMIVDDFGVPVSRILTRMHESERAAAIEALAQYQRDVRPYLSDEVRTVR